ncbi:MAG TPA: HPF/RaiA family ribosome-associated protein [Hyphomicrobiaceae bacterium]|nr:HPF/RaiA family ribosome-associated protein [Hyphomicrobiaceae bacterium]
MQRPLQITFKNMDNSPAFDSLIRERVAALEKFYPRIIGCRVVVETPYRSADSAKQPIGIAVEVDVPNHNTIVSKDAQERHDAKMDHTAPINRAFDAVERQLQKIADVREQRVKTSEAEGQSGMVVRLFPEQSYGFIEMDGSPELYFTRNAVTGGDFDDLEVGTLVYVTRSSEEGPMGPQANSVKLLTRKKSPE